MRHDACSLCDLLRREACSLCDLLRFEACSLCDLLRREACCLCDFLRCEACCLCDLLRREACSLCDLYVDVIRIPLVKMERRTVPNLVAMLITMIAMTTTAGTTTTVMMIMMMMMLMMMMLMMIMMMMMMMMLMMMMGVVVTMVVMVMITKTTISNQTYSRHVNLRYALLVEQHKLTGAVIDGDVSQVHLHVDQLVQRRQSGRPHEHGQLRVLQPRHLTWPARTHRKVTPGKSIAWYRCEFSICHRVASFRTLYV